MGITYIEGTVSGSQGSRTLEFLVDSGASYTLLPHDVWTAIGLTPKRTTDYTFRALESGCKGGVRWTKRRR